MTPYALAVLSLALALVVLSIATGIMTRAALRPPYRRAAMVVAIGLALLALHSALNLELALHTGIFDLRQSLLSAGSSLFLLLGLTGLKR